MSQNSELISFVKEARVRGFEDFQIRDSLLNNGWPSEEIEKAFVYLKSKKESKNRIQIHLDDKVLKKLEKRAEKNMLNLNEQVEDILRRSVLNLQKKTPTEEKVDDKFITFFSRKKR
jgi:hypothetical protein